MTDGKQQVTKRPVYSALLSFRNYIVKIIPENSFLFKWLALIGMKLVAKEKLKIRSTLDLTVPVVDHCNLRCKCCSAFAPLAKETFIDLERFKGDITRLASINNNDIRAFYISGGEPLLHPHICEVFNIVRSLFPDASICLHTNGLLLLQMPEEFWENLLKNNVSIEITRYPIDINLDGIKEKCQQYGIWQGCIGKESAPIKTMWKYPLDLSGKQPLKSSFNICNQRNTCTFLKDGIVYPCMVIANIRHFNEYFNQDLQLSNDDVINIYDANDIKEIKEFLITPKPFCKYCNRKAVKFGIPFGISEKVITEWT